MQCLKGNFLQTQQDETREQRGAVIAQPQVTPQFNV